MKFLCLCIGVFFLASLIEGTIRHLPLEVIRVDLVWLLVIYIGFFVPLFPGGILVFLLGLAKEAVGAPFHGILPLSFLPVYFFLRLIQGQIFFEGAFSQMIWVVLLTLAQRSIEQGVLIWQGYPVILTLSGFRILLLSAFLNGTVSLILFPFFKKVGNLATDYGT